MSNQNQSKGKLGEKLAAAFLQKKGYRIIARHFTLRGGELDLVAVHKNTLVCVEVKTRTGSSFGSALEAITRWKLTALIKSAQFFQSQHPQLPEGLRIDLVAIQLDDLGKIVTIDHIENITG